MKKLWHNLDNIENTISKQKNTMTKIIEHKDVDLCKLQKYDEDICQFDKQNSST